MNEQPHVSIVVRPSYSAEIVQLESESLSSTAEIRALQATDEDAYKRIVEQGRTIATFIKRVEEWFEPYITPLRSQLDAIYGSRKSILDIALGDKKYLAEQVSAFERAQERIRQDNERKQRLEQEQRDKQAKLDSAVAAEQAGASPAAVTRILDSPVTSIAPQAAPTFQKAAGTVGRKYWKAFPIDDDHQTAFQTLVKAAAKDASLLPYIMLNESACNKKADAEKTAMRLPGYEARCESKSTFRAV